MRGGRSTVITTVIHSGVLSTNNPLIGDRFSRNTSAIIGVVVSATVGVILSVLIVFFFCKRFRDRKERKNRRRSRRSGLRFSGSGSGPRRAASGAGSGPSGGGLSRDSSALILGVGYTGEQSRSRSGEEPDERDERDEYEDDDEDDEDVWRSPLVEEVGICMRTGGVAGLPTPSESGDSRPAGDSGGGRKSSISHSVPSRANSNGHTNSRSHSHSSRHGNGRSLEGAVYAGPSAVVLATNPGTGAGGISQLPSMAEFGTGPPVSYAGYTYPPGSVGYYAGGGIGEDQALASTSGAQSTQSALGTQRSSFASLGGFASCPSSYMPHASHAPFHVPYGSQGTVGAPLPTSGVMGYIGGETGEIGREGVVLAEPTSAPGECENISSASGRGAKRRLTASTTGGHVTPPEPARTRSGSAPPTMGSLRSTSRGGKSLRGIMNRIRTSVPNIQVADGVLPSRRSSRDMSSGSLSTMTTGGRPGYDYGVVGRPSQRHAREGKGAQIQAPAGYPHLTVPPGAAGVDSYHQAQSKGYVPYAYGQAVGVSSLAAERDSEAEDEDSIRVRGGVVTNGLLDPDLSLGHAFAGNRGGDGGGRSSPNVEGASLRDYVDYTRRIGGMVKNSMARSTTTFETFDQDGHSVPGTPG